MGYLTDIINRPFHAELLDDAQFLELKDRMNSSQSIMDKLGEFGVSSSDLYNYHEFFDPAKNKK